MKEFIRFLLQPRVPLWKYCLTAVPLALVPSAAAFAMVSALLRVNEVNLDGLLPPQRESSVAEFLGVVLFAPIVETAILGVLLRSLLKLSTRHGFVAAASALLWGALHATFGVLWFFGTAWSFFVFSCAYLGWHQRSSKTAFAAAAVPHALINLLAFSFSAAQNAA